MVKLVSIELDIWREYVPMYHGTRYCLKIKTTNDDGSQFQWLPTLTYKGNWEECTTYECRSIDKAYDKEDVKKIGEEIIKNCERLGEKYYLTSELYERMRNIGSLLFRYIIR